MLFIFPKPSKVRVRSNVANEVRHNHQQIYGDIPVALMSAMGGKRTLAVDIH
jgi:hypothetical protein